MRGSRLLIVVSALLHASTAASATWEPGVDAQSDISVVQIRAHGDNEYCGGALIVLQINVYDDNRNCAPR